MVDVYLDHNVARALAPLLTQRGHPARTARDEGLDHAGDPAQLLHAVQHGWALITHDRDDFRDLHDAWLRWRVHITIGNHHGIFILEQAGPEVMARALTTLLNHSSPFPNQLFEWTRVTGWRTGPPLRPPL